MPRSPILLALLVAGCGAQAGHGGGVFEDGVLRDFPRNPNRPLQQGLGANGKHIIFCNFDGATLSAGYDDATHNASSIAYGVGHSVTIPPFNYADFSTTRSRDQIINDLLTKVRNYFQDFNVDVVSTRPTSGNYVMAMVGGTAALVNQSSQVAGLAPLDCQRGSNNKPIYNAQDDVEVIFAFSGLLHDPAYRSGNYNFDIGDVAATIAQEVGHAYGLAHTQNASDVMYPVLQSQLPAGFLAGPYADNGNCAGNVGTQDSHAVLINILGAATTTQPMDTTPPTVSFTSPSQGATVGRLVSVFISATDDTGVDHVVVTASGVATLTKTLGAPPYSFNLAAPGDGALDLTATAFDAAGNQATATVSVTVAGPMMMPQPQPFGSACTAASQCQSGVCAGGFCNQACSAAAPCPSGYHCGASLVCDKGDPTQPQPMPAGDVGAACATGKDCNSGRCTEQGGTRFCTAACKTADAASCPDGMICAASADGTAQCVFPTSDGNTVMGGCSVSRARPPLPLEALLLLGLLALALRRRAPIARR